MQQQCRMLSHRVTIFCHQIVPPANSHPYRRSHSSHSVAETSFHSQLVLPEPICCCHGHHYVPEERLPAANGQLSGLVLSLRGYGNQKTPLRNSCRRAPERNHAISASSNQVWSSSSTRLLGLHVLDRRSQAVRRQESFGPSPGPDRAEALLPRLYKSV